MSTKVMAGLTFVALLHACAPFRNVTPEMRRQAAAIPVLTVEQVGSRKYAIIAEVVGRSCATDEGSNPSIEVAREALKIQAAQVSADAVVRVLCKEGNVGLRGNCIECRGDAAKWEAR